MKESNFINYGSLSTFSDLKAVASNADFSRPSIREKAPNQAQTRALVGMYNILHGVDGFMDKDVFYTYYGLITDAIDKIKKYHGYRSVEIASLMLVKLKKNGIIAEHTDEAGDYDIAHRVHIPIKTNAGCIFTVNGEQYHMREGDIVELNNIVPHSVVNGDQDRVHLIFDIIGMKHEFDESLLNKPVPEWFYLKD